MTAISDQVNQATSGLSKIMMQQQQFAEIKTLLTGIKIDTQNPTQRELDLVLDEEYRLQNRLQILKEAYEQNKVQQDEHITSDNNRILRRK